MVDKPLKDHIRFSPDILARLGEELIPSPEQGVIELVKNAYDAEASDCTIKLKSTRGVVTEIIVTDNGVGMNENAIRTGWLVLGRSTKLNERLQTGKFMRFPVGDKGLGRLSALRQGSQVLMVTRPISEPGVQYSVCISWSDFELAKVVEDVNLQIVKGESDKSSGTDIVIKNIKGGLSKPNIERLARDLVLLADPFSSRFGFKINLVAPEFTDLEQLVKNAYFDESDYHLVAKVRNGISSAQILDFKGDIIDEAEHSEIINRSQKKKKEHDSYIMPDGDFELWVFLLGSKSYSIRKSPVNVIKNWLSAVGGVHIYHRGIRIKPYGDPGNDWLEMNLSRVRSPEERPSTNNSIGVVIIDDPEDALLPKTDRIGFVESQIYFEFRQFCTDSLEWMANVRLTAAENRRKKEKDQKSKQTSNSRDTLKKVIEAQVPDGVRPIVQKAVEEYQSALEKEVRSLRGDLQLYRSLATAGAIIAKFAHQTNQPISLVLRLANVFKSKESKLLQPDESYTKSVQLLQTAGETLRSYSSIPLNLLKHEKRRLGVVFVREAIKNSIDLLGPFIERANISVECEFFDGEICIQGSEALLEAIVTNFITNSITALTEGELVRTQDRKINIRTFFEKDIAIIRVLDNGPGILISMDEIWLPGRTTTTNGTGFGLTIVQDCVSDLGGKASAIASGELGGAEFTVELPAFISKQGKLL